ncbi:protein DPCD-like [Corticium candelabrum]|uniref:protein DPCD-like n=1 Tax=Corticium candelabrum TaxID=121492 RepID=UPI002E264C5F|nr:protein DPCD-like [Corticium candelabrum]
MAEASSWIKTLKAAKKSCLVQDGKRKIHFTLPDGKEMVEEYDQRTGELSVRKWRRKSTLGTTTQWEFEVGEAPYQAILNLESEHIRASSTNPVFVRRDTAKAFEWRVRNLPYLIPTYNVYVDDEQKHVVVKTTNRKYFKKYDIPDMTRAGLKLEQEALSIAHANNTLIISYKKPQLIVEQERLMKKELSKLKATHDGDVECPQS